MPQKIGRQSATDSMESLMAFCRAGAGHRAIAATLLRRASSIYEVDASSTVRPGGIDAKAIQAMLAFSSYLRIGMVSFAHHSQARHIGPIDLVMKGFFPEGSKVLYAHLGGVPSSTVTATHCVTDEGRWRTFRASPALTGEWNSPPR